jgi:hypothetical protein
MFARPFTSVTSASMLLAIAILGACSSPPAGGTGSVDTAGCFPNCKDVLIGGSDTGGSTDEDTTDPTDIGGGNTETGGPPAKFEGYHAAELNVRIVGPSGRGHAVVSGSVVEVAGVVFGKADSITWSTEGGDTGSAHGAPFFQTDAIKLNPGDNVVTITAKNAQETATDTVKITYNPTFSFQDRLRVDPNVMKVGKSGAVYVKVFIGSNPNVVKGSVKVFAIDAQGSQIAALGTCVDDGGVAKGTSSDEVVDGIYTCKVSPQCTTAGDILLRASVDVQMATGKYTAFSDVAIVECVADWNSQECSDAMSALKSAKASSDAAGGGAAGTKAAIDTLMGYTSVVESAGPASPVPGGADGFGAWVKFKSGVLGAVSVGDGTTRGGGGDGAGSGGPEEDGAALSTVQLQSRRTLMLDPFNSDFGPDEVAAASKLASSNGCPAFTTEAPKAADLHVFRHAYEYGIFAVATHGDAYFKTLDKTAYDMKHPGSQEVLWTGHTVNPNYFGKAGAPAATCSDTKPCGPESECFVNALGGNGVCVDHLTADLRRGRVILGSNGNYGVTGRFFSHHAQENYPRSLEYLGACRSLWNGTLAGEFLAVGAAAVAGYSGYVANDFAVKWGGTFFDNLISQKQLSGVAHVQIEDTTNPGTAFMLIGAQNLDAAYSDIINSSFEAGNIQGWLKTGDGRVISQLGNTTAVGGKFMAVISTGLGYTAESGELKQAFCIPAGKTTMSYWWKYYSEEFKEFCGSAYQDEFYCKIDVAGKSKTIMDVRIDDLCPGGKQDKGLTLADVHFDQGPGGDVWMTPWVHQVADITPLAGGAAVTVRFFATDAGDGIYDTAVLIDKLEFQ